VWQKGTPQSIAARALLLELLDGQVQVKFFPSHESVPVDGRSAGSSRLISRNPVGLPMPNSWLPIRSVGRLC